MPQLWTEYFREWARALLRTPQLVKHVAFRPRTIEEELVEATLKGALRRALAGYNLLSLGVGQVIGSGVFILTGQAALTTGPAVIVSYLLSGVAATLAATCYAEFAIEYPVAGGGFTFIMLTFGELPAWITVSNLMLEYVLGTAAIARGFSQYIARLIFPHDEHVEQHLLEENLDFPAFGIVLVLTAIACAGVRESAFLITVLAAIHLLLIAAMIIAAFTQAHTSYLSPFLLGGTDNMFAAGAMVFFAYAGFDVVASAAEEAQKPQHIPWALVGTTLIATLVYVLLTLSLAMMIPTNGDADLPGSFGRAAFSTAFLEVGLTGMYYVTCVTALTGTITSLLVGLYGTARIVMCAARDWLIPPILATIYPRTQTPLIAQVVIGVVIAMMALAVSFDTLSELVSISTLLVMCLVANALLFRRYYPGLPRLRYSRWGTVESAEGKSLMPYTVPGARLSVRVRQWLVVGHLLLINVVCIGLTVYYQARTLFLKDADESVMRDADTSNDPPPNNNHFSRWEGELALGLMWLAATLSLQLCCPLEYEPPKWHIPWWLMPWLPSTSILLMIFTAGSMQNRDMYIVFACWMVGCLVVYFLFSLPMSYIKHYKLDYVNTEQMNVVELSFQNGRWLPRPSFKGTLHPMPSSRMLSAPTSRLSGIPSHLLHTTFAQRDSSSPGSTQCSEVQLATGKGSEARGRSLQGLPPVRSSLGSPSLGQGFPTTAASTCESPSVRGSPSAGACPSIQEECPSVEAAGTHSTLSSGVGEEPHTPDLQSIR